MPTPIIARSRWCRLQQNLRSLAQEECEGWRAEESGLVDALLSRERTGFTNDRCSSQFARYPPGLHDGHTLLRVTRPGSPNAQTFGAARQAFSRHGLRWTIAPCEAPPPMLSALTRSDQMSNYGISRWSCTRQEASGTFGRGRKIGA